VQCYNGHKCLNSYLKKRYTPAWDHFPHGLVYGLYPWFMGLYPKSHLVSICLTTMYQLLLLRSLNEDAGKLSKACCKKTFRYLLRGNPQRNASQCRTRQSLWSVAYFKVLPFVSGEQDHGELSEDTRSNSRDLKRELTVWANLLSELRLTVISIIWL
jgi:hypothetical protein